MFWGNPNLGIISFKRTCATSIALSALVGKTATHPLNVCIRTSRDLYPLQGTMWVKSTCQSSPGWSPLLCIGFTKGGSVGPRLLWAPREQALQTCLVMAVNPSPVTVYMPQPGRYLSFPCGRNPVRTQLSSTGLPRAGIISSPLSTILPLYLSLFGKHPFPPPGCTGVLSY